jgi:hypothetical protein
VRPVCCILVNHKQPNQKAPELAMTESWGALRVEVRDDEIIITLPGTSYMVTYHKPANSPQLLAKY